jgi:large subunit ribosomal protein L3
MLDAIFATKLGMTQAWSKSGKRLAVTKCKADANLIVGQHAASVTDKTSRIWQKHPQTILEVGFGTKKLKNMHKPLKNRLTKSGFSYGVKQIQGLHYNQPEESPLKVGDFVSLEQVLAVGDVVKVQGISKGRGFAGAMKRHGFHGGPATHGQSDRARAVGAIGAHTTPGRTWPGQRAAGHYGVDTKTVSGLVVLHIDPATKEVWLSGPVPGSITSIVKIEKTGRKRAVELDLASLGLQPAEPVEAVVEEKVEEAIEEKVEAKVEKVEAKVEQPVEQPKEKLVKPKKKAAAKKK